MSDLEFAPKPDPVARLAETVLDAVDSLVVALDPEGRVVQFNRACELATGYGFEEIKGVPFWDVFIAPERVAAAKARFLGLRDGECPTAFDLYWIKKDGRRRLIVGSSRVDLQACKLEYSIVSPK